MPKYKVGNLRVLQKDVALADGSSLVDMKASTIGDGNMYDVSTITLTSVIATDAVTVDKEVFTFVASNPTTGQVLKGATDAAAATNLAAAIVAREIEGVVSATASGAVVTITSSLWLSDITSEDETISIEKHTQADSSGNLFERVSEVAAANEEIIGSLQSLASRIEALENA